MQEITVEIWFQNKNYKVETEKDGKLMKNISESQTVMKQKKNNTTNLQRRFIFLSLNLFWLSVAFTQHLF